MDEVYDLAELLTDAMDNLGYNQAELSRRSGVSKQTVSDYVNRKRIKPDPDALAALAKALGLPVERVYRAAKIPVSRQTRNTTEMDSVLEAMRDLPEEWQAKIAEDARRTREFYEAQAAERERRGPRPATGGV